MHKKVRRLRSQEKKLRERPQEIPLSLSLESALRKKEGARTSTENLGVPTLEAGVHSEREIEDHLLH